MRFRFSVRDLLWLAVVVALAVGWWLNVQRLKATAKHNLDQLMVEKDQEILKIRQVIQRVQDLSHSEP